FWLPPFAGREPEPEEDTFPPISRRNLYKHPIFWARFLGYAIPLGFLLYVLYLNYLPFGYHKTFTITVGSPDDTKVSEFYLEPSKGLSERKTAEDGTTYRELNGVGKVVFKPKAVLKDALITVETNDPGISFIPPYVDINPQEISWDIDWNLTKEVPQELENTNVFYFEGEPYFDGTSRLEYASSSDMFEDGPFTVYAEWKPKDAENDFQQIVGHFNWEVLQNKNVVRFMVGRVDNAEGKFYIADYTIPDPTTFFSNKHALLAIYNPDPENGNGYIEIYVDGYFGSRINIGNSVIWKDYNGTKNLTSGKSGHGAAKYYQGSIYAIRIRKRTFLKEYQKIYLDFSEIKSSIKIPILSQTSSTFKNVKLHADQD
ncbi:MAG: hypothetical protein KIH65_003525, partial [Candidatus Uhrbacteria bacterium]|nr:hypothetical protein [Candidatus Uhrbacteria bacterium]